MLKLVDGRAFGAEAGFIPSLRGASSEQLSGLQASADGAYLVVADLDLHINVDGLVTRIMEKPPLTIKRSGARLAGLATSPTKALASARLISVNHGSVSSRRSLNRTCRSPASGFLLRHQAFALGRSERRCGKL